MQFAPKTDKELAEALLWPKGEYDFEVLEAVDAVSKSGNDMIKLKLCCFFGEKQKQVTDYLLASMEHRLKHFCDAAGLAEVYAKGELSAELCKGRTGKVKLKVEEQPGYNPKMAVADYVKPAEGATVPGEDVPSAPRRVPNAAAAGAADDVPFMRPSDLGI